MGRLLYNDGVTAVCRFDETEPIPPETIKMLLAIDTSKQIPDGCLPTLLECFITAMPCRLPSQISKEEKQAFSDAADIARLRELGFTIEGGYLEAFVTKEMLFAYSIERTRENSLYVAEYIQYLAKLYLLSGGDARHSELFPTTPTLADDAIRVDAVLPIRLMRRLQEVTINAPAIFEVEHAAVSPDGRTFAVPVKIPFVKVGRYPFFPSDSYMHLRSDEFEWKRIAAAAILPSLLNRMTAEQYALDPETHKLLHGDANALVNMLAEYIIDGRIRACPHCGRPVLMLRDSSKPFCGKSCQQRYREDAQRMRASGASVDDVSTAYPCINRKTIECWPEPKKGC